MGQSARIREIGDPPAPPVQQSPASKNICRVQLRLAKIRRVRAVLQSRAVRP